MMRPVLTREEYLSLRDGGQQKEVLKAVRSGNARQKNRLVQMNYSCLPNEDGSLKASKRMSTTVGMDLDWTPSPLPLEGEEQIAARKEEWLRMVPEQVLSKKEELGLLMLERSATKGYHLVFRRRPELSQEDNLRWAAGLLGVEFDEGAKDITRVFFTTTEDDLIYLSDSLFEIEEVEEVKEEVKTVNGLVVKKEVKEDDSQVNSKLLSLNSQLLYHGIPYSRIVDAWLEGKKVKEGDRHRTSLYLADHLRYITDNDAALIEQILRQTPFVQEIVQERGENVAQTVKSAQSYDFYKNIPKKMQQALRRAGVDCESEEEDENLTIGEDPEDNQHSMTNGQWRKMPQGVKDSIDAVGPSLAMPVLTAICPCIGALATGVVLDVHGQKKGLNLISYIAGDFASGKGAIDPVIEAWMSEVSALDKMYQMQEDEWRAKKRAAKNKKEQPEEPKLPVRFLTLNNTVANLAERLANTEGKHAFSFTPEADTVAQKWKSTMSDFSVMLRQSYDGTRYDREARSADAVNVHIEQLLWNVTMCGTPDALYRVVSNYTDGFQSRIALARTPDNTFSPLEEKPYVLTPRQTDHIQQVAHLLPLMHGEVVLPKLERNGRKWLESIRLETMMNDDKVRARQRFRVCVTAQRMTCCLMLCKVCETLIQKHGLSGAEARLKQYPDLWKEMLLQAQTPQMMNAYDVIADSLLENALHFFRDRIENAFSSHDYIGDAGSERVRRGKNDSIYERLDIQFTFEQAMQQSVAVKGAGVTHNSVKQMLKNWKNQHLIAMAESGEYRKVSSKGH